MLTTVSTPDISADAPNFPADPHPLRAQLQRAHLGMSRGWAWVGAIGWMLALVAVGIIVGFLAIAATDQPIAPQAKNPSADTRDLGHAAPPLAAVERWWARTHERKP